MRVFIDGKEVEAKDVKVMYSNLGHNKERLEIVLRDSYVQHEVFDKDGFSHEEPYVATPLEIANHVCNP